MVMHQNVYAQKIELAEADAFYEEYLYDEAITKYQEVLNMEIKPKMELYVLGQIARCHQYTFQYTQAEAHYAKMLEKTGDSRPDLLLEYAIMLKFNGKYQAAKAAFKQYNKLTEGLDTYGSFQMRSVNWAIANDSFIKPVFVAPTNLDISGASLGYTIYQKGLLYAHGRNKKPYFTMQLFDLDYAKRIDSVTFVPDSNIAALIQFEGNEGFPCISADKKELYFAANSTVIRTEKMKALFKRAASKDNKLNFKIYKAKLENGKFTKVEELMFNNNEYNCTHPFLTEDGKSLYFISDMPGTYGGYDIFVVKKDRNGNWGSPQNLGKSINSEENEIYPFVYHNKFYFATKGIPGYGGYDIFSAEMNERGQIAKPINMGKPINSFSDDFALIAYGDGNTGYFSSNRLDADGKDKVYYFRNYPKGFPSTTDTSNTPLQKELSIIEDVADSAIETEVFKVVFNSVGFGLNETKLTDEVKHVLDSAATITKQSGDIRIEVDAHTDSRGTGIYNKDLSLKRANEVKNYLVGKGVSAWRISARGYGEEKLLNKCADGVDCTEEEHTQNRRVELRMMK
jgi:outer membrane protein OmpA-like peptidoglycan-associated protein/tetratricopeptide (TPR) repeat protein